MIEPRLWRVLVGAVVAMIVVVILTLAWMLNNSLATARRVEAAQQDIKRLTTSQLNQVKGQNNDQLCTQYTILLGIRDVEIKLGLPTNDIVLPDVSGLECDPDAAT